MATKNIVPRTGSDGGKIGTASKRWSEGNFDTVVLNPSESSTVVEYPPSSGFYATESYAYHAHYSNSSGLVGSTALAAFEADPANPYFPPGFVQQRMNIYSGSAEVGHQILTPNTSSLRLGNAYNALEIGESTFVADGDAFTLYGRSFLAAQVPKINVQAFFGNSFYDVQMLDMYPSSHGNTISGHMALGYSEALSGALVSADQTNFGYPGAPPLDGANLHFQTFNNADGLQPRMTIMPSGNVGIGTLVAGYELEVNGEVSASAYYGDGSNLSGISAENFDTTATSGQTNLPLVMVVSPGGADSEPKTDADIFFNSATNTLAVPNVSSSVNISASVFYGDSAEITNITASGHVSASVFYGDGSQLDGISGGSPGGSTTEIQFNDAGNFGASAALSWQTSAGTLGTTQTLEIGASSVPQANEQGAQLSILGAYNSDTSGYFPPKISLGGPGNTAPGGSVSYSADSFYISSSSPGTASFTSINNELQLDSNLSTLGQFYNSGEDKGTETADFTIDWDEGMTQELILSGAAATTLTASFSNVKPYATYQLIHKIGKDNMAIYFSNSIHWPGGTRPTLSTTSGSIDVLTFTTDGSSNLYGVAQYAFSASVG